MSAAPAVTNDQAAWVAYRWQGRVPDPPPARDLDGLAAEILAYRVRGGRARGLELRDLQDPWDSGAERRALVRLVFTTRDSGEVEEAFSLVTAGETAAEVMEACRTAAKLRRAA